MKKANLESLGHTELSICFTSNKKSSEEWRTILGIYLLQIMYCDCTATVLHSK